MFDAQNHTKNAVFEAKNHSKWRFGGSKSESAAIKKERHAVHSETHASKMQNYEGNTNLEVSKVMVLPQNVWFCFMVKIRLKPWRYLQSKPMVSSGESMNG